MDLKNMEKIINELLNEADDLDQEAFYLREKAEAYQMALDHALETAQEVKDEMTYD